MPLAFSNTLCGMCRSTVLYITRWLTTWLSSMTASASLNQAAQSLSQKPDTTLLYFIIFIAQQHSNLFLPNKCLTPLFFILSY